MHRFWFGITFLFVFNFAATPVAMAHTPIAVGNNESLQGATLIPDATKSWASYAELHESGEAQYFQFDAAQGTVIPISLYTSPADEEADFAPSFVLMGPGIPSQGSVPDYIEVPLAAGQMVLKGVRPAEATFEAFAPSAFVEVAKLSFEAPTDGTYYVAVFDEERGGRYGVAIGSRETSTLYEWIVNPLAFPAIYVWSGQNWFLIFVPALLAFALGIGILLRSKRKLDSAAWIAAIAGLFFIGSGVTVASQMIVSLLKAPADGFVIVTIFLAVLPIVLGLFTLRVAALAGPQWTLRSRAGLLLLGVLALFLWSGWIVGPALAIIAAVLPTKSS